MRFPGHGASQPAGRPDGTPYNFAAGNVGVQGQDFINTDIYIVAPEDDPKTKYDKGVRCLAAGLPSLALDQINAAIAEGCRSTEVCFHWLLAELASRSDEQFTELDRQALRKRLSGFEPGDDEWAGGVEAILAVLTALDDDSKTAVALGRLHALPVPQQETIRRHLDAYLSATIRNELWQQLARDAADRQSRNNRRWRSRFYFVPNPSAPRTRRPDLPSTTNRERWQARIAAFVLSLGTGYLGWLVLERAWWPALAAYPSMVATGAMAAWAVLRWRHGVERLHAEERKYRPGPPRPPADGDGFAREVDRLFDRYFRQQAPREVDIEHWLVQTGGYRTTLREELVNLYRESRVGAAKIRWLVRFVVKDVRKGWDAGTLWEYRERYRTPFLVRVTACLGIMALVPALAFSVAAGVMADPILGSLDIPLLLVSGAVAAARWLGIELERRRYQDEDAACAERARARGEGYDAWRRRLDQNRPSEEQMADWLDADRTVLLAKALEEYKLQHRDIVRYAMLETPLGRLRNRARRGPWRYARYRFRLFLLTGNGVRMYTSTLGFREAAFSDVRHTVFGFDAITSADVTMADELPSTLDLRLVDGRVIEVRVTGEADDPPPKPVATRRAVTRTAAAGAWRQRGPQSVDDAADLRDATKRTLESSGLPHTLHVLEGIAAEGKQWMHRSRSQPV